MEYARIACGNSIPITTRDEHKWEQGTALSADCVQPCAERVSTRRPKIYFDTAGHPGLIRKRVKSGVLGNLPPKHRDRFGPLSAKAVFRPQSPLILCIGVVSGTSNDNAATVYPKSHVHNAGITASTIGLVSDAERDSHLWKT